MFLIFLFSFISPPIGSHPSTYDEYEESFDKELGTFSCFSDKKVIKISQINDGIVDCDDGSDEPGTGVFLNSSFYCKNEGHIPKILLSSDISDGNCDCCDGSDEFFNDMIKCNNNCKEREDERQVLLGEISVFFNKAKVIRDRRKEDGLKTLMEAKKRRQEILDMISSYQDEKRGMDVSRESTYVRSRAIFEKIRVLEKEIELLSVNGDGSYEILNKLIGKKEELKKLKNEMDEPNKSEVDQYQHFKGGFRNNDPMDISIIEPKWKAVIRCIWQFTFQVPTFKSTIKDGIRRRTLDELLKKIRMKEKDLEEVEKIIRLGEMNRPELIAIYKEKFKKDNYEYDVLEELKEGDVSLGHYSRNDESAQILVEGDFCPEINKSRESVLELICYDIDKLVSVDEQSVCKVHAIFSTPSACTEEYINNIQGTSMEEIQMIFSKIGIE